MNVELKYHFIYNVQQLYISKLSYIGIIKPFFVLLKQRPGVAAILFKNNCKLNVHKTNKKKYIPIKYKKRFQDLGCLCIQLAIEAGQFQNIERHNRICFLCSNSIKDEFHFILMCPMYESYRKKYIKVLHDTET